MKQLLKRLTTDNKDEILDEILDPIWDKCYVGSNLEPLNEIEKNLIVARSIQFSVFVGGISSYFFNKGNKYTALGLEAFKEIGLTKVYHIFKRSIELFPVQPIPDDLETCRQIMKKQLTDENPIKLQWNLLSDEFYNLEEYITDTCLEYIKKTCK